MAALEQLYALYEKYEETSREVHSKAPRFAGAFGLGDDPRAHGCHEAFFEDVARWVRDFMDGDPSQQEIAQAVHWILEAADARRNTVTYWYLYAVQGHAGAMIPQLSRNESLTLLQWYDRAYPERDRLPVHREVYRLLQERSGVESLAHKNGLLRFFRKVKKTP